MAGISFGGSIISRRGEGIQILGHRGRGDHHVRVKVHVPKKLSSKQKELLRAYVETEEHQDMPEHKSFWGKIKDYLG